MTSRISKGSITGRAAFSNGGLGLSIGSKVSGGIRHAISRRAPDASKIAGAVAPAAPVNPAYNFTKTIVYTTFDGFFPNEPPPYITAMSITLLTTSSISTMFSKKLDEITIGNIQSALGNNFKVIFKYGSSQTVEQFISNVSNNVYNFTIPSFATALITDNPPASTVLYWNGSAFSKTGSAADLSLTITTGFGYDPDAAGLAELKTDLSTHIIGKTITFTMTNNNEFNVKSTNGNLNITYFKE